MCSSKSPSKSVSTLPPALAWLTPAGTQMPELNSFDTRPPDMPPCTWYEVSSRRMIAATEGRSERELGASNDTLNGNDVLGHQLDGWGLVEVNADEADVIASLQLATSSNVLNPLSTWSEDNLSVFRNPRGTFTSHAFPDVSGSNPTAVEWPEGASGEGGGVVLLVVPSKHPVGSEGSGHLVPVLRVRGHLRRPVSALSVGRGDDSVVRHDCWSISLTLQLVNTALQPRQSRISTHDFVLSLFRAMSWSISLRLRVRPPASTKSSSSTFPLRQSLALVGPSTAF